MWLFGAIRALASRFNTEDSVSDFLGAIEASQRGLTVHAWRLPHGECGFIVHRCLAEVIRRRS